jgi:hypothetical protein
MGLVAKLDDLGKPAWIGLMILGFWWFWPVGLAVLAYLIGSGRMGCWGQHGGDRLQRRMNRMQDKMERMQERARSWSAGFSRPATSGNRAFDDYRDETLRRLEDEQREFFEFLDRLRHAKDKAEFDQFMAERGRQANEPKDGPHTSPQA